MLPSLAKFLNEYTYVRMTNSPVSCAQVVNANWDSMMTLILGRRQEPNNYAVLSIRGSESFTTPGHTSRQNPVHAEYIVFPVSGFSTSQDETSSNETSQARALAPLVLS
jgi:hypothetical protein